MENKWEYDYSNMYQNPYTPNNNGYQSYNAASAGGSAGAPSPAPMGPDLSEPKPPKKGTGKKVALSALALVLVGAVSFGGGWAGYSMASRETGNRVVYQSVQPAEMGSGDDGTLSSGGLVNVSSAVSPSVVVVTTDKLVTNNFWGGTQVVSGAGSGVIYTQDGYIITNNHVIADAQKVTVKLYDGAEHAATVVGTDPQTDVAVLKIEASGLTPAILGDSDTVKVGETVIAVGNPMGTLGGTITNGIISGINRSITVGGNEMKLMQTNAAVSPGNSGGGLFNANGELIGIVNAKSAGENAEGLGFAIPVNTAKQVAQDLIENGYVSGRPVLGITVIDVQDAQTAFQLGVSSMGVYVQDVVAGSGAEKAGVKSGDRIIAVGSRLVEQSADVLSALTEYTAGDEVEVQIVRDHDLMTMKVTLGERVQK